MKMDTRGEHDTKRSFFGLDSDSKVVSEVDRYQLYTSGYTMFAKRDFTTASLHFSKIVIFKLCDRQWIVDTEDFVFNL